MSQQLPKYVEKKLNDIRFYFRLFLIIALGAAIPLVKMSCQPTIQNLLYLNFISGENTTGTVIKSKRNKAADYTGNRSNNYQRTPAYDVTVEFTDKKGTVHTASAAILKKIDTGAKITVTYAPDNPEIIDFPKFRSGYIAEWLCALAVFLIFCPLAIGYGISYFSKKRSLKTKEINVTATLADSRETEENSKKIIEYKFDYNINGQKHTMDIIYAINKMTGDEGIEHFWHSVYINGDSGGTTLLDVALDQPRWHKSTPESSRGYELFAINDQSSSFFENRSELAVAYFTEHPQMTAILDEKFNTFFGPPAKKKK